MAKQNPKVTVLTAVYNQEKFIQETIASVLNQTFTDFEYIIVDDKSSDNTTKIVKSFKDTRIRLIESDKNLGPFGAANIGLNFAKGKYIARLDSDDVCYPNRLSEQVEFLDNNPEYKLIGSWRIIINENSYPIDIARPSIEHDQLIASMFFGCSIAHSTAMFDREFFKKSGNYIEKRQAQDWELYFRIMTSGGKIHNLPKYLVAYRNSSNNITNTVPEKQEKEGRIILKNYLKSYLNIDISLKDLKIIRNILLSKKRNYTREEKIVFVNYCRQILHSFKDKNASDLTINFIKNYSTQRFDTLIGNSFIKRSIKSWFYRFA